MQILKLIIKSFLSLFLPVFNVSTKVVHDTYIRGKLYVGLDSKFDKRLKFIKNGTCLINENQVLKVRSRGSTTSDDFSDLILICDVILEL